MNHSFTCKGFSVLCLKGHETKESKWSIKPDLSNSCWLRGLMNGSVNMRSANCAVQSNSSMANGNPQVIRSGSPWFKWKWKWQQVNTKENFGSSGPNWDAERSVVVVLLETAGHPKRSERIADETCTLQRTLFRLVSIGPSRRAKRTSCAGCCWETRVAAKTTTHMCMC